MFFTLGQAAAEVGISKSKLSKDIKAGKLSISKTDGNSFAIDPAELFRVYPPKAEKERLENERKQRLEQKETPSETTELMILKLEKERLETSLADQKAERLREREQYEREIERLTKSAEGWQEQAQVVKLLTDQNKKTEFENNKKSGWFSFLKS